MENSGDTASPPPPPPLPLPQQGFAQGGYMAQQGGNTPKGAGKGAFVIQQHPGYGGAASPHGSSFAGSWTPAGQMPVAQMNGAYPQGGGYSMVPGGAQPAGMGYHPQVVQAPQRFAFQVQ
jgi:hypothetical protein